MTSGLRTFYDPHSLFCHSAYGCTSVR